MTTENPLVSVIIPIYNTAFYLRNCLDSLLKQTYTNLEILLINDGSTDESGNIADEYSRKDARIKVFHRTNQGAAAARNFGVGQATGALIHFLDSDYSILPDTYQTVVQALLVNKADCVVWNKLPVKLKSGLNTDADYTAAILHTIEGNGIGPALWTQLYRRKLFCEYAIQAPSHLIHYEDKAVVLQYALAAKNVYYLHGYSFVIHTINPNSVSHSYEKNIKAHIIDEIRYFRDLLSKENLPYQPFLARWIAAQLYRVYWNESSSARNTTPLKTKLALLRDVFEEPFISSQVISITQTKSLRFYVWLTLKMTQWHFYVGGYGLVKCIYKTKRFLQALHK